MIRVIVNAASLLTDRFCEVETINLIHVEKNMEKPEIMIYSWWLFHI